MRLLVSLYMWTIWLLAGVLGFPLMIACMSLFPRKQAYVYIRALCRFFLAACGIRVTARGVEQLDLSRPYILMGNHVNLLDPFTWACAIPVPFSGVEKKENFKIPFYGWLMGRWGNVPIDRKNLEQAKKDLAKAAEWMHREGIWMIVMPEGTRTRDGYVAPFKKGGFHMALDAHADIVPFTFNGSFHVLRNGDWKVYPGTIEIVFGEAIPTEGYTKDTLDQLVARVREAIAANLHTI